MGAGKMNLSEYKYDSVLNSYELTQQQYNDILAESTIIGDIERLVESHCCGPHWFSTIIQNNDNFYTLSRGWGLYWEITENNPDGDFYSLKLEHKWGYQI